MAENSENIEAKLCAYVEGDLDEQGRVEIERHLDAHPNHRRLLSELMATRDLLRVLPREQAPPELAESFNAQLERSALLDGAGIESTTPSLRANLLPRVLALAAVMLLAVGLVVVVIFSLPQSNYFIAKSDSAAPADGPTSGPIVAALPSEAAVEADSARARRRRDEFAKDGSALREAGRTDRMSKKGDPAAFARAAAKGGGGGQGDAAIPGAIADARVETARQFQSQMQRLGGASQIVGNTAPLAADPVYLVVCTNDPVSTVREVASNLEVQRVTWEPTRDTPLPPAEPRPDQSATGNIEPTNRYDARVEFDNAIQKKQTLQLAQRRQQLTQLHDLASQDGGAAGRMSKADPAGAGEGAGNAGQQKQQPPQQRAEASQTEIASASTRDDTRGAAEPAGPPTAPSTTPPPAPAAAPAEPEEVAVATDAKLKADITSIPAKPDQPATEEAEQAKRDKRLASEDSELATAAPQAAPQVQELQQQASSQADAHADAQADVDVSGIVAYRMTARQLAELSRTLNRGAAQQAEVIADHEHLLRALEATTATAATTAPATGVVVDGSDTDAEKGWKDLAVALRTQTTSRPTREMRKADATTPTTADAQRAPGAPADNLAAAAIAPDDATDEGVKPNASAESVVRENVTTPKPAERSPTTRPTHGYVFAEARDRSIREKEMSRAGKGGPTPPTIIERGCNLSVTVDELAGPGTDKTTAVQVAPDGTIQLPRLQPVRVEGLTLEKCEEVVADAYKAANVIDSPTVSIERVRPAAVAIARHSDAAGKRAGQAAQPAAPGGVKADSFEQADSGAVPNKTANALIELKSGEKATTEPYGCPDDGQLVDVVILVQRNRNADPVAQPDANASVSETAVDQAKGADAAEDSPAAKQDAAPSESEIPPAQEVQPAK